MILLICYRERAREECPRARKTHRDAQHFHRNPDVSRDRRSQRYSLWRERWIHQRQHDSSTVEPLKRIRVYTYIRVRYHAYIIIADDRTSWKPSACQTPSAREDNVSVVYIYFTYTRYLILKRQFFWQKQNSLRKSSKRDSYFYVL